MILISLNAFLSLTLISSYSAEQYARSPVSTTLLSGSECKPVPHYTHVLASAGIELTVFLVAGKVLCFELSMRRMLITLMVSAVAK